MRVILFEMLNNLNERLVGPALRNAGRQIYQWGNSLEGQSLSEDRLTPSLRRLAHQGIEPDVDNASFVAPNATVMGDVKVGDNSSLWYGTTVLGTAPISIGDNSVVQDRVHISRGSSIGNQVFVGPNSILQGATLQSRSFVSMGATVRHSTVHSGGMVAAGAVVNPGNEVKEGEIWAGNPAQLLRNVTPLEREVLREHLEEMQELAVMHSEETEKSTREVINGENKVDDGGSIEDYLDDLENYKYAYTEQDSEFLEARILLKENMQFPEWGRDYQPYRFEHSGLPEKFKVGLHEQEFAKVALKLKPKESFDNINARKPWSSKF